MIITLIICTTVVLIAAIIAYYNYKVTHKEHIEDYLYSIKSSLSSISDKLRDIKDMTWNVDCATSDIQDILEGKHKTKD